MRRVIGFGYSQSGRFLREFIRDGFNQDERGRAAFDGLMIASAGAGRRQLQSSICQSRTGRQFGALHPSTRRSASVH